MSRTSPLYKMPLAKIRSLFGRLPHVFTHSLQFRVRLLPLVIFCAVLMLSVRLYNIKRQLEGEPSAPIVTASLWAQAAPKPTNPAPQDAPPAQNSPPVVAPAPTAVSATPPTQPSNATASQPQLQVPTSGASPANPVTPSNATQAPSSDAQKPFDPLSLTPEEMQVLQSLAKRRNEIEGKESALKARENLLKEMEGKLGQKLEDLKKLKGDIQTLVKSHEDTEQAKIKNLVKIYESMKPKDAARIMSQLQVGVLLDVVSQMKPQKVSAIMANMDPAIASGLTDELARRQDLTDKALQASKAQNSSAGAPPVGQGAPVLAANPAPITPQPAAAAGQSTPQTSK